MASESPRIQNSSGFHCFCSIETTNKRTLVTIVCVALSILLIIAAAEIYFKGAPFLPQCFQTPIGRVIGAAVLGSMGIAIDVILLLSNVCCKKASEPQPPLEAPREDHTCFFAEETLEDEKTFFMMAVGETHFDKAQKIFFEAYQLNGFEEAVHFLKQCYENKKAIFYLFDPSTNTLNLAATGGEIYFKVQDDHAEAKFEDIMLSGQSKALWKTQLPPSVKHICLRFANKTHTILINR